MINLYMIFHYDDEVITRFGSVITQKAFDTFIGSNQPNEARLVEEKISFPDAFLGGGIRTALVHYLGDKRFAAYVPVFPTDDESKAYNAAFGR